MSTDTLKEKPYLEGRTGNYRTHRLPWEGLSGKRPWDVAIRVQEIPINRRCNSSARELRSKITALVRCFSRCALCDGHEDFGSYRSSLPWYRLLRANSAARSNSTADDVVTTVRQLRRTYMLPTLTQIEDKAVAAEACHIAAQDAQWALIGGEIPKSKWGEDHGIAFLLPASKEAQKQLERIATSDGYRRIKRFSVGICHSTSPNHPGGADWVAVAFYIGKFEAVIEKPQSF